MIIITESKTLRTEDLTPDDIKLEDIARGLSHMPRFSGQIPASYSVAMHSMLVHDILAHPYVAAMPDATGYVDAVGSVRTYLAGLLHDASEAYICDIPSPLKKKLPEYAKVEETIMSAVFRRFNIGDLWPMNATLKAADKLALYVEAQRWFPGRELLICGMWDQQGPPWVTDRQKQQVRFDAEIAGLGCSIETAASYLQSLLGCEYSAAEVQWQFMRGVRGYL